MLTQGVCRLAVWLAADVDSLCAQIFTSNLNKPDTALASPASLCVCIIQPQSHHCPTRSFHPSAAEDGLAMEGPVFRAMPEDELLQLLPRLQVSDHAGLVARPAVAAQRCALIHGHASGAHAACLACARPSRWPPSLVPCHHSSRARTATTQVSIDALPTYAGAGPLQPEGQVHLGADAEEVRRGALVHCRAMYACV